MSMHLVRGMTSNRTTKRRNPPSEAKLKVWRGEWKKHCKVFRENRLRPPTFDEFVERVYGYVPERPVEVAKKPDPVLEESRRHREKYRSMEGETYVPYERTVMDPRSLEAEDEQTRKAILAKSRRIAPAYNKGAASYVTDGMDTQELGRKL
jgi:hypothetical protein